METIDQKVLNALTDVANNVSKKYRNVCMALIDNAQRSCAENGLKDAGDVVNAITGNALLTYVTFSGKFEDADSAAYCIDKAIEYLQKWSYRIHKCERERETAPESN